MFSICAKKKKSLHWSAWLSWVVGGNEIGGKVMTHRFLSDTANLPQWATQWGIQHWVGSRSQGLCTFFCFYIHLQLRRQDGTFRAAHAACFCKSVYSSFTHCWSPHAAPWLRDRPAGFGFYDLWCQRRRRDVLSRPGLDCHLIGHLECLSQGQDDLVRLGLGERKE